VFCKMSILMADFAFEGKLFIINLLHVVPFIQGEVNSFGQAFFQIYFYTYARTGLKAIFRFCSIYVLSKCISYSSNSFAIPTMQREEGEANPYWYCIRNIILRIKIWGPTIEIHTSGAHKVRSASEDEISICFIFEEKGKEASSTKKVREISFQMGFPVLVDPDRHSPRRRPDSRKLSNECLFCKFQSEGSGASLDLNRRDLIQFFHKLWRSLFVRLGKRGNKGGKSLNICGEMEGEEAGGPEASPGEGGMRAGEGVST
jgi:hypothetical protein